MRKRVKLQRRDGVAMITISALAPDGRRSGFDADLRAGLGNALSVALEDAAVRAVILRAGPEGWPLADDPALDYLDLEAPGGADTAPGLAVLAERIAAARVPVVALLSGTIAGGGLALSQAAALRLALPDTRFLMREYGVGLIPAAGALVRLARRIGGALALATVMQPGPVGAASAMTLGLCDAVLEEDALEAAAIEAATRRPLNAPDPEAGISDTALYLREMEAARARIVPGPLAPVALRAVEVIEAAALLPLEEALSFEAVAYLDLAADPRSRGLCHADAALRAAETLAGDGVPDPETQDWRGVVGLWNMGEMLALALIRLGHEVIFAGPRREVLDRAWSKISARLLELGVGSGPDDAAHRTVMARLHIATDTEALGAAEVVIGALPAGPEAAQAAAEALRAACAPGAVLALDGVVPRAGELGFIRHGGLRELVPGTGLPEADLRRLAVLMGRSGVIPVLGGGYPGIAARLEAAFYAAAERCVMAGATPEAVDRALEAFGFARGPMRRIDEIGATLVDDRMAAAHRAPGPYLSYLQIAGQTGRAAGQGSYIWSEDGQFAPAPDLDETLAALREEAGIVPVPIGASELVARVMSELAAEGAALLQSGAAHRASDVDLAALVVLGLARLRGGPLFWADETGLLPVRKRLRALVEEGAPGPVALWDALIRDGARFAGIGA